MQQTCEIHKGLSKTFHMTLFQSRILIGGWDTAILSSCQSGCHRNQFGILNFAHSFTFGQCFTFVVYSVTENPILTKKTGLKHPFLNFFWPFCTYGCWRRVTIATKIYFLKSTFKRPFIWAQDLCSIFSQSVYPQGGHLPGEGGHLLGGGGTFAKGRGETWGGGGRQVGRGGGGHGIGTSGPGCPHHTTTRCLPERDFGQQPVFFRRNRMSSFWRQDKTSLLSHPFLKSQSHIQPLHPAWGSRAYVEKVRHSHFNLWPTTVLDFLTTVW